VRAEVHDDFHAKEVTTYQNMRHLVNDVKYVQQHILKLFDLLRQARLLTCRAQRACALLWSSSMIRLQCWQCSWHC
jgi:hypothetical protein